MEILYKGNLDSLAYAKNLCSNIESNFPEHREHEATKICGICEPKAKEFFNRFVTRMKIWIPKGELKKILLENSSNHKEFLIQLQRKGELISELEIAKENGHHHQYRRKSI